MTITTTMRATATRPALRITRPDHRGFCMVSIVTADGTVTDVGSITRHALGGWGSASGGRAYRTFRMAAEARYADYRWAQVDAALRPFTQGREAVAE